MDLYQLIINQAANALDEDVGSGDISAELIDADTRLAQRFTGPSEKGSSYQSCNLMLQSHPKTE